MAIDLITLALLAACLGRNHGLNTHFLSELANEESWRFTASPDDRRGACGFSRGSNECAFGRSSLGKRHYAKCLHYGDPDSRATLPTTNRARAMSFLTFMCANYDINTTQTLWQYFRTWKQLYHHIV